MLGAGRRAIFAKGHVPDVMDGTFDGPVAPTGNLDLSGAQFGSRATGEEDFGFFGHAPGLEMMSGANNHRRLGGVRKTDGFRGDVEGIDLPSFMPTMGLAEMDVRRGKKSPWGPWKGGRVCRRAWVDWL